MGDRDTIDDIRRALSSPRDVADKLGLRGRVEGHGFKAVCPAHGDRSPSLSLTVGPDGTLRVRCFGCELAGDVFSLVAAVERLETGRDFPAVLEAAARIAGVTLTDRPSGAPRAPRAPLPPPMPAGPPPLDDERFAEIVAPLLTMGRLDTDDEVRERGRSAVCGDVCDYLASRGLLDLARAEGWAALPPQGPSQASWVAMLVDLFGEDDVKRTGLVPVGEDGAIVPRGFVQGGARLVIPWRRPDGVITTLQRRRLDDQKPKYVSPMGRAPRFPYGIERLGAWDPTIPIVLVEGAIDTEAMRVICARQGTPAVVLGIQGVQGWRSEWCEYFRGRVTAVAFDNVPTDQSESSLRKVEAMRKGIERLIADLEPWGVARIERWRPSGDAKDWADMLVEPASVKGAA